ncbi:DMT family transporter [Lysinibacillus pakistanensis]|uniref:DMT family transporter n=1 Tax=Lysinibacillus pakistanensis TaxID=759811 RepID=A0AAX3WS22_9BACI|nr:DMT family transporter [Lysinibacillus pakistanensis]MDM5230024.1 DMT family transporter [Lysinibacillus pakistanensis]WHY45622.1 DMT family transporter [Lysinibacillus pakistanensis]WHY50630.1 DMT family transporter [Lysinibacillus pakistanensis]
MENPKINPYIPIFIGVISVSLSAIFVKLANAEAGIIAFYRMLFSVLIMAPLFFWKYTKELRQLSKRDWLFSSIAGIFLAFHFILWFESLNYTSVASSTVLVTLQPLFAFVGTYFFFKEKITMKTIFAGTIAIVGSVLISWGDFKLSGAAFYGDILALIACALVTAYLLFGQDVRKRLSLVTYTMLVYVVSTITLFAYVLIKGESFGPYPTMDWVWFILLAIVPNLFGHTLFNWAIKYVSTNVVSIAILFEPIGAAILALLIFKEYLIVTQLIGGLIVIMGILLFVIDEKKILKFFSKNA